jgi:hypothetical protein
MRRKSCGINKKKLFSFLYIFYFIFRRRTWTTTRDGGGDGNKLKENGVSKIMKKLQPEIFEGENVGNASQELTKATELKKIFAQLFLIAINFFVVEKNCVHSR